jgi:uncharacterized surface protein with fasciclin (FAS1) repeats
MDGKANFFNKSITKMIRIKQIFFPSLFVLIFFFSCRDDMQFDKYERPEWLAGKIYTQILEQPELSTFAKCMKIAGYDTIVNVSGSYTVFAPSNQAFDSWFAQNSNYNSVENIPVDEVTRLVKYHILQNPWTKAQLRSLDVHGWIDTLDVNNDKPKGYKRETLLREPNRKFGWTQLPGGRTQLLDTLSATHHRRVITDSRKYAPIFYQEYFDIYELLPDDYEFYFNRPFEGGKNLYFANGKLVGDGIFAENGFIYMIDQVVEPLRSAYRIMENESGSDNYSHFLELINNFPEFDYNEVRTFDQEGAEQGLQVDSLFDLSFPELTFNVTSEKTTPPKGTYGLPQNVTIRYHHGLLAPTNSAFENLINDYVKIPGGWGTLDGAPEHIRRIIANTHMSTNSIYPSEFERGFYNGEIDIVRLNQDNIVKKEYGSNSSFIGLDKAIVPRAFSSVTGPVYLRQGFSKIMYAIEEADLLPLLKRENKNYSFFVESDMNTSQDSSLIYNQIDNRFFVFEIAEEGGLFEQKSLNKNDLRTLLLNHIAVETPKGIARKEFIPNLAGNYFIFNNETEEVSGTSGTTIGYNGSVSAPEFPRVLAETDNGTTFEINNWFSFGSPTIYSRISTQYPAFHSLLRKAGYDRDKESRYTFISNSEFYTIFIPTEAAIDSAGLNSMPVEDLRKVLLFHFVQGELIFTDGNMSADYFQTARVDEKSTPFSTVYSRLYIEPGIDEIRFRDKSGSVFTSINESESTNRLTGINTGTGQEVFPNTFNNAVIHEIDEVLIFEELDTQ